MDRNWLLTSPPSNSASTSKFPSHAWTPTSPKSTTRKSPRSPPTVPSSPFTTPPSWSSNKTCLANTLNTWSSNRNSVPNWRTPSKTCKRPYRTLISTSIEMSFSLVFWSTPPKSSRFTSISRTNVLWTGSELLPAVWDRLRCSMTKWRNWTRRTTSSNTSQKNSIWLKWPNTTTPWRNWSPSINSTISPNRSFSTTRSSRASIWATPKGPNWTLCLLKTVKRRLKNRSRWERRETRSWKSRLKIIWRI